MYVGGWVDHSFPSHRTGTLLENKYNVDLRNWRPMRRFLKIWIVVHLIRNICDIHDMH